MTEKHKRKPINLELKGRKFVDLSHTIENGLVSYKGLPAPLICDYMSREESRHLYDEGTEFRIAKIEMVGNTGTYLDCPFHRYEQGKDLSEMSIQQLTDLDGIVIRVDSQVSRSIDVDCFKGKEIRGKAVLVNTGWDQFWNSDMYFENHPYLTEGAARYLIDCEVKLVGIDSMNMDDTTRKQRPVHSLLLAEEIPIVEHLCKLDQLPETGFTFTALPPKFKGTGTFPVRAMAKIEL
nr:cyclase family protein [Pseudalkalibacillus decolorationis]